MKTTVVIVPKAPLWAMVLLVATVLLGWAVYSTLTAPPAPAMQPVGDVYSTQVGTSVR
jgi:hypothetical protein